MVVDLSTTDFVTRAQIIELCQALGVDPNITGEVRIEPNRITVTELHRHLGTVQREWKRLGIDDCTECGRHAGQCDHAESDCNCCWCYREGRGA